MPQWTKTMNTILQKRIEAESNKYMEEAIEMNGVVGDNLHYKDLKTCFIEAADFALQNQWISVEEGLPTERDEEDEQYSTNVFARTKDCIRYAYYDFHNESWCSVEGGYRFGGDVTHWMPIPSLKGGEK